MVLEGFLKLNSFNVLLVFDFLFNILISLKKFVVLGFSQLKSLIQISLELLLKSIHLILLSLN